VDGEALTVLRDGARSASVLDGRVRSVEGPDGNTFIGPGSDTLEVASFAGWAGGPPQGNVESFAHGGNFGAFGDRSPVADMPKSGAASWAGASVGMMLENGTPFVTTSDVAIATTDFNDVTFRSTNTVKQKPGEPTVTGAGNMDFDMRGTISGNSFTAGDARMQVEGGFYGAAAAEAAGTFNGNVRGNAYGGAFGARRSPP